MHTIRNINQLDARNKAPKEPDYSLFLCPIRFHDHDSLVISFLFKISGIKLPPTVNKQTKNDTVTKNKTKKNRMILQYIRPTYFNSSIIWIQ